MVKDTQNNLYYFIISFSKEKNPLEVPRKIGAPCKRKPLHGTLAFESLAVSFVNLVYLFSL